MARTVRNPKIDTRSARARLAQRREPYWTVISGGCALGYRRGANGGTWIAKFRSENGKRYLKALGPADDARDADGLTVFSFAQAQERAREWFSAKLGRRPAILLLLIGPTRWPMPSPIIGPTIYAAAVRRPIALTGPQMRDQTGTGQYRVGEAH